MAADPVGFVLVGAGAIAQTWGQAFAAASDAVELRAVCDVRADAAAALAEPLGVVASDDLAAVLADPRIEAAVVCTPPSTHRSITELLVDSGQHVLCEKPLATGIEDATAMLHAAEQAGVILTMASKFRFVEDVQLARSMVGAGAIGEPLLFSNAFVARAAMDERWNSDPAVSGGGVLIDNGTHSVDIARYLLGPLAEVHATSVSSVGAHGVDGTARLLLRSAGGVSGLVTLSWQAANFANTFLEIVGTDGAIRVGWSRSRVRRAASPSWEEFGSGYDKLHAHTRQLETFATAVRGEGPLLISEDDALASVAALDAAHRSLGSGAWEEVRNVRDAARLDR